ncbi:hypothetical protein PR048_025711 [Dryococelus australis]|uniref:Uncharacterized protein n=1 Tax=Dryococelus australis TaxID=614101 RepID=A0ABQ9GJC9_9NEOP|nr:hypothetical protein PR048_025711 [Dryococelus australis]
MKNFCKRCEGEPLKLHETLTNPALVYATPVDNVGNLRISIVAGCETIKNSQGIHQRIRVSIQRRVDACVLDSGEIRQITGVSESEVWGKKRPSPVIKIDVDVPVGIITGTSKKQSSDTNQNPYDGVKRCRERKINIKASERVNVDVLPQNKRQCYQHSHNTFLSLATLQRREQGIEPWSSRMRNSVKLHLHGAEKYPGSRTLVGCNRECTIDYTNVQQRLQGGFQSWRAWSARLQTRDVTATPRGARESGLMLLAVEGGGRCRFALEGKEGKEARGINRRTWASCERSLNRSCACAKRGLARTKRRTSTPPPSQPPSPASDRTIQPTLLASPLERAPHRREKKGDAKQRNGQTWADKMWPDYSSPTNANRIQFRRRRSRILACGNLSELCRWSAGLLGDLPFPPPLHSGTASHSPHFTLIGSQDHDLSVTLNSSNWAPVHDVCSVVVTLLESRRATSYGCNSSHPVWHALYECLQDIHGDSSQFLLQPFHVLSNGFWPRLTSPHPAIQFVPKMFYRVEVGALGRSVQSANIVVGVPLHSSPWNMAPGIVILEVTRDHSVKTPQCWEPHIIQDVTIGLCVHATTDKHQRSYAEGRETQASGFSRGSPVPPPLHSDAAPYTHHSPQLTLKAIAVESRPIDLCFTAFGVGPLVFVRGSINTEAYCNILDNEMLPALWHFYGMDPCYFQDDNARCHVSRATMQWYADNNVRRLDWPAQSPDRNPIEHFLGRIGSPGEGSSGVAKIHCSTHGIVAREMATNPHGCPAHTRGEHARQDGCCYSHKRWPCEILTGCGSSVAEQFGIAHSTVSHYLNEKNSCTKGVKSQDTCNTLLDYRCRDQETALRKCVPSVTSTECFIDAYQPEMAFLWCRGHKDWVLSNVDSTPSRNVKSLVTAIVPHFFFFVCVLSVVLCALSSSSLTLPQLTLQLLSLSCWRMEKFAAWSLYTSWQESVGRSQSAGVSRSESVQSVGGHPIPITHSTLVVGEAVHHIFCRCGQQPCWSVQFIILVVVQHIARSKAGLHHPVYGLACRHSGVYLQTPRPESHIDDFTIFHILQHLYAFYSAQLHMRQHPFDRL